MYRLFHDRALDEARRLFITDGQDTSHGGGHSAAVEDEPEDIASDDLDGGDDADRDDDGQPRGKRAEKQDQAYREIQSRLDKATAALERSTELNQRMEERLRRQEEDGSRRSRRNSEDGDDDPIRTKVRTRARELKSELGKLNREDPEYTEKYMETMLDRIYRDVHDEVSQISQQTARGEVSRAKSHEQQAQEARVEALEALEEAGFDESYLDDLIDLSTSKQATDPQWFKTVKSDEQIGKLVDELKDRWAPRLKQSHDIQNKKRDHRRGMDDVIDDGARRPRRSSREDSDEAKGPGSFLTDLRRLQGERKAIAKGMFKQRAAGY